MTYVITQACVDVLDRARIEECPVDCSYEGERRLCIPSVADLPRKSRTTAV